MTKAERIYADTKTRCRQNIKVWGFENIGFDRMHTDEIIYKRTENEIRKLIEKDYKDLEFDIKLDILTDEQIKDIIQVIKMTELTLNNHPIF